MRTHALAFLFFSTIACCVFFSGNLFADGGSDKDHGKSSYTVGDLISHADTFYWIAMAERGSMVAITKGLKYLDKAEKKLKNGDYSKKEKEKYEAKIAALREDLNQQKHLAYNTHYGVFPLARFVTTTLFSDPRSSGSFELLDDPDEVATREAVEDLVEHILHAQTFVPQYDVVFISDVGDEIRRDLENEALYVFNRSARFFVHNLHEMDTISDPQKIWPHGQLVPTNAIIEKLFDHEDFRSSHLLIVRVRRIDEADGGYYFYVAEGRVFERSSSDAPVKQTVVLNNYGFCIDRFNMLPPIIIMHGLLLIVAVLVYRELVRIISHTGEYPPWQNACAMGGMAFAWGRLLMWVICPILAGIAPSPETLAWWSFWWPAAAGVAIVLGPAAVMRFAEHRFKWIGPWFSMFNRGGAIFACVAIGSGAFLAQSALIFEGPPAWPLTVPLLIAAPLAAYVVGRALDATDAVKLPYGVAALVATLCLGLAWCHADARFVWLVLLPITGLAVAATMQASQIKLARPKKCESNAEADAPKVSEKAAGSDLIRLASNPPFHETAAYKRLWNSLAPWEQGKMVKLALVGPAGSGKSAMLSAMQQKARVKHPDVKVVRGPRVTVMRGACAEPKDGSAPKPFECFSEAISQHFSVNLLAPPADEMKHIDEALGGMFDSVVPFADILFPPSEQGQSGSKKELFVAIVAMLRRLSKQQPVLLILDDVHWMDPASKDLLDHLLKEFANDEDCPLAFLLACRETSDLALKDEHVRIIQVEAPSQDELRAILVEGMKMQSETAGNVLNAVGDQRDNLHWLLQIIAHLAEKDLFVWRDGGFSWKDKSVRLSEHIPDGYRQSIRSSLESHREFRPVLECAACVGQEFSVEAVSRGVEMSRLELIHLLDRIEAETGMIRDVREKDDTYAFRSAFMLEVLRDLLEVSAKGAKQAAAPQRIREYHFRLASGLEGTLNESNAHLYEVANHYYAAGTRCAGKALDFSLRAAKAASAQFQHDLARQYVAMARSCGAIAASRKRELERELLLIECREARIEGKDRVAMAEQCQTYLRDNPNADFIVQVAAAQACYDAGVDTRDQQHFADCVEIAKTMIDKFEGPLEQAEAHHFWGIGLPVSESEDRRKHMEKAMSLVDALDANNRDGLRLKARIANSLAEQLSYSKDADDRRQAGEYFAMSIELKSREDIRDVEGLAFAHGGLGRLHYFAPEPDYETARKHFAEDLRFSEQIGSLAGQTKMHSLLAACDLQESLQGGSEKFDSALQHYEAALQLAEEQFDTFFALAGLVECHESLKQHDEASKYGQLLVDLTQSRLAALSESERKENPAAAIPAPCLDGIRKALSQCELCRSAAWHKWLSELVNHNRIPSEK